MDKVVLEFEGKVFDYNTDNVPEKPGLYMVCALYSGGNSLVYSDVLYVGESDNLKSRIRSHCGDWIRREAVRESIAVVYAYMVFEGDEKERFRLESALTFALKPDFNAYNKDEYKKDDIQLIIKGAGIKGWNIKSAYVVHNGDKS